jgi:hypothetical protein
MAVRKPIPGQIENRNFLVPTGFQFQVNRAPKVSYFGQMVNIPSLNFNNATQPNYLREIPLPGTMIDFEDLTLRFLVDESLENYLEIQNWIRGIGFPESLQQIYDFQKEDTDLEQPARSQLNLYSDGTLTVLDSQNLPKFKVVFENLFPVSLSTLEFDATQTDLEYFTAEVTFKYTIYNIREVSCNPCT